MKTTLFSIIGLALAANLSSLSGTTVIQSPGFIEVKGTLDSGIIAPDDVGNTLDYLKFEVLSLTTITVTSGFNSALLLMLAAFIGDNDEFGFIDNPFRLEQTSSTEWSTLTRSLDPGIYIAVISDRFDTIYDIYDGFTAVNLEGGGFWADYAYTIAGDVRALEYWDGELDGTFKITVIPEPTALCSLGFGVLGLALRRSKSRP